MSECPTAPGAGVVRAAALAFVRATRPLVWRICRAYGVRVEMHCTPTGQHPLVIEDSPEASRRHIPQSVRFNTRSGAITVGAGTVFGEDVHVLTGKHFSIAEAEATGLPLHHVPSHGRGIAIGRGCYIGSGAIVIGPVRVGDYAVIGAGAVVTHNVPDRTFVAGVPARIVRRL